MSGKYRPAQFVDPRGGLIENRPNINALSIFAGTPTASVAGYEVGGIAIDRTNGIIYCNTGTATSSTWTAVFGTTIASATFTAATITTATITTANTTTENVVTLTVSAAGSTPVAMSNGDGSTAMTAKTQILGANKGAASLTLGCFSATATTVATPSLDFLKSAHATVGSNTVVASGEVLGEINFFGADGTDFNSAACRIAGLVDATPGTGDMPGRLVFSTSVDNAETLTESFRVDNAQRVVIGAVAAQSVSTGDGATSATPRGQLWGTTNATASLLIGCSSATAGTAAGLAFARSKNAAVGSFTTVASGDALGAITWFGDNGTDYLSPAAQIAGFSDATPGAADMPGQIRFLTTPDGSETMTEKWRINNVGVLTSLAGTPANAGTVIGSILPSGGIAITDVANAWIDDATHGSGTVAHLIGNQTITTSSDVRIKKNILPYTGALSAIDRAPRVVSFEYDHPDWGGDRAAPNDEDARKWGPNARGRYVGFLAQETIEWAPWVVNAGAGKDCPKCQKGQKCDDPSHPIWHVEYQHLVPMLVQCIKELKEKVTALEAKCA